MQYPISTAIASDIASNPTVGGLNWQASFVSGYMPLNVIFTRSTVATYTNSAGVLTTAAINQPRFDYDPVTLQPRGILIEVTRTNLLFNSATLSTQSVTVTNVAHTISFYGTGTVTLSGASTAGPLVGTGAYPNRVQLTFTPTADTLTVTVSGSVQFAQLEVGTFASSYIPTTSTAVTRNADTATVSSLNTIGFNPLEGTVVAVFSYMGIAPTFGQRAFELNDGTSNERISVGIVSGNTMAATIVDGALIVANITLAASAAINTTYKTAMAYKLNDIASCANGGTVGTDTTAAIPTVDRMLVGGTVSGTARLGGWLQSLTYYPTRLPNSQLQALTVA